MVVDSVAKKAVIASLLLLASAHTLHEMLPEYAEMSSVASLPDTSASSAASFEPLQTLKMRLRGSGSNEFAG